MSPVILSGTVAISVTVGSTLLAVTETLDSAIAGFIVALTVLIHTLIAERTRREAKKTSPKMVRENTRRILKTEQRVRGNEDNLNELLRSKDEAIERLNHRVEELIEIIDSRLGGIEK